MVASGVRKRILITGGSGLIGRAVIQSLLARNNLDLKVQVRDKAQARASVGDVVDFTKVQLEDGDFTRMGDRELTYLTRGCNIVIHAAGLVHKPDAPYQEYEVVNVRATQALAEASIKNGVDTFIFLSSSAVYGTGPFEMVDEKAQVLGKTPYAVSKMASENWLGMQQQSIPRIIILRPSLVFGEGDRGNMLSLIKNVKQNKYKHVGDGGAGKSIIYARDVAYAIGLCMDKLQQGFHIFNLANPQPVSVKDLTEEIAESLGMSRKIASVPTGFMKFGVKAAELFMKDSAPLNSEQLAKLTTTTTCAIEKLVNETGFQPRVSLKTALKSEIDWATRENLL
jgi:nucleoside-diphosphate-sugar epimerase